tara:strand:- start:3002 stop:4186 length:1185 start_codon:yes stop_codon:yes gene_type:complete
MNNSAVGLQQYLFISLGFFIPISIAISNIIIGLLVFCWILEGGFKIKFHTIKSLKWLLALFALIGLYLIGLFWGENHVDAAWQFQRLALLLLFPILATIRIHQNTIKNGAIAFLSATLCSAIFAILINNNLISPLSEYISIIHSGSQTSAFIKYNYHNVLLAIASTLCMYLLIEKKTKNRKTLIICIVIYATSIFTESGRAGQILFNLASLFYIIYYSRKYILRGVSLLLLLFFFQALIYNTTSVYKNRLDATSSIIKNNGDVIKGTGKNIRYIFLSESLKRIFAKPILGYGTGSFASIFNNEVTSGHDFSLHKTPHNQYIYVWFEIGIAGLCFLIFIFYYQIMDLLQKHDGIHRSLLPLTFVFLMLVDSYFFIFILTSAYIYLYTIYSRYESE